ncbi:MAG: hypothetical protein AAB263_08700 [Planctomycetota bacterium]
MRMLAIVVMLPALLTAAQTQPAAKADAGGQPTPTETAALELINVYRAKTREAENRFEVILREYADKKAPMISGWVARSWVNGNSKLQGGIAPVVINPALMASARGLLNGKIQWINNQRLPFAEPFRGAGYTPNANGLILVGAQAPSLRATFVRAMTNTTSETPEKPPKAHYTFAGREALDPGWREVGIAVDESGGKFSLVIILGRGSATRYLGGATFADANHNSTCDSGEALAGVKITAGDVSTVSGPTGVWWMELKNADAIDVVISGGGFTSTRKVAAGTGNVGIDWRVPNTNDIKNAKKFLADAEKGAKDKDEEKRRKALATVLSGTRMAILDDELQRTVDAFTQPIREDYDELIRKAMAALSEDEATFKTRMHEYELPWKGALTSWFKEMNNLYQLRQQVNEMSSARADKRAATVPALTTQLTKAIASSCDPTLQEQYELLRTSLECLPPPPATAPAAPKK